jgi:hypothetical protein
MPCGEADVKLTLRTRDEYRRRMKLGRCGKCGGKKDDPHLTNCAKCRAWQAKRYLERKAEKAKGMS